MPIPFPEDSVEGNHSYNEEENPDPHSNTRGGWGSKSKHEEEIQELRGQRLSSTGLLEIKCRRRERRRPGRTAATENKSRGPPRDAASRRAGCLGAGNAWRATCSPMGEHPPRPG